MSHHLDLHTATDGALFITKVPLNLHYPQQDLSEYASTLR